MYHLESIGLITGINWELSLPTRESMLDHAITTIASIGRHEFTLDQDYPDVTITTSYRVWNYQKIES